MLSVDKLIEIYGESNPVKVIKQENSPIEIIEYKAIFQREFSSEYGSNPDQIAHSIRYKNLSSETIVAMRFGIVAFDMFNHMIGKFAGYAVETLDSSMEEKGDWVQSVYAAFTFQKYGTGVAYVDAVRFENGKIWNLDLAMVVEDLQRIELSLTQEDLLEKRSRNN